MNPLRSSLAYWSVYRKHIGNRLYIISVLTLLAAATEGLGIAMLLPLATQLDIAHQSNQPTGFAAALYGLLGKLGIQGSLVGILIFISLVFFLKGLLKFAEGGYRSYLQSQLALEVRAKLIDTYATMDYRFYSGHNTGHFVNVVNVQVNSLLLAFDQYQRFIAGLIMMAAYFSFAFLLSWKFASMSLVIGLVILLVFRELNRYVRRLSQLTAEESGTLNHFLVQAMQAFKYLAATATIEPLRKAVSRSIRRLTDNLRRQGIAAAFTDAIREPIAVSVLVLIIVVQLTLLDAALAPILVALLFIYRAMGQVMGVQATWQKTMNHIGSLEMIESELNEAGSHQQQGGPVVLMPFADSIRFRDVCFAFEPGHRDVLSNINLTIPANRTIALVGESGSGKSTLVDLMTLLLRPTQGEILIDGESHNDIDLTSWRSQIGYVSQETVVFDDTIANNISLWRRNNSREADARSKIETAAARANAQRLIDELPDGYNTVVGDRGVRLSGGQRQRLFIARELYKDPRILILDEATSALDSKSELAIKESVDQLKGSTTVVIIAHRLSTIRDADYIYVLDAGRIVEEGSYQELLAIDKGRFKRMVEIQSL
jgi:subfamily B ATP-binding cassette protein MsbA